MRQVVQRMLQMMLATLVLSSAACDSPSSHTQGVGHGVGELVIAADVGERLAQFVPTPIEVDTSGLSSCSLPNMSPVDRLLHCFFQNRKHELWHIRS